MSKKTISIAIKDSTEKEELEEIMLNFCDVVDCNDYVCSDHNCDGCIFFEVNLFKEWLSD